MSFAFVAGDVPERSLLLISLGGSSWPGTSLNNNQNTLSKFLESMDTDSRLCETPSLLVSGFGLSNFIDCGNFILSSRMTISFAPLSSVAVFRESNDGGTSIDETDAADGPV